MGPKTKEQCLHCAKVGTQKTKVFCTKTIKAIPPCLHDTKICCKKTLRCMKRLYRKCDIFCGELCSGRTVCWINVICFLPVLLYLSIKIYLIPCIQVSLGRIFTLVFCSPCRMWCPEDYIFTDNEFPANIRSLQLEDKSIEKSVLWIRAHELAAEETEDDQTTELKICRDEHEDEEYEEYQTKQKNQEQKEPEMYLFRNGINPSDVVQGQLGDCWLLAAIACLAEFPGAIENCFCSYERSERHKYYIKLYDARKGVERFKKIYIDDYIPCDEVTHRPIFAKPKGNELWVLLLEKAFAKFVGNYGRLDGGHTLWAFQAITGNHCMRFEYDAGEIIAANDHHNKRENEHVVEEEEEEEEEDEERDQNPNGYSNSPCWKKWLIEYDRAIHINEPREDYGWIDSGEAFDNQRLWSLLMKYDKYDALIAASATSNGEQKRDDGIVEGHAYTIKQVVSFEQYKLLNIRNPWGHFEWNGKWSDGDTKTWNKHPNIAEKVNFVSSDDGAFWMEFCDFLTIFNVIEICDRTTISNLHLNVNEDANTKYHMGIAKGCFKGCYEYWCCLKGLKNVYFGRRESSTAVVDVGNQFGTCCPCISNQNHGKSWNEEVE